MENHEASATQEPQGSRTALTAHTPGPWNVDQGKPTKTRGIDIIGPNTRHVVASVHFPSEVWSSVESQTRARATARLIAAAPDLLAALELMTDQYEQVCHDNNVMGWPAAVEHARAAIAKATEPK